MNDRAGPGRSPHVGHRDRDHERQSAQTDTVVAGTSCDGASDSVFPSVHGEEDDVLLLSQSFDDTAMKYDFRAPEGTSLLVWTISRDGFGILFGEKLDRTGQTGGHTTRGQGGSKCKDALLSVVVNRGS